MSAAKHAPAAWRIERNTKMQFCVVRDTPEGKEFQLSAGGRPSSFKTWRAAEHIKRRLNVGEAIAKATGSAA